MNEPKQQPVIILGMHRSGTTMVAGLLSRLGLLVGRDIQQDQESHLFLDINKRLFQQCNAYWDNPLPISMFMKNETARQLSTRAVQADLDSCRVRNYLGLSDYLKHKRLWHYPLPWGWKDPRTVFTLPLWLDIFPGARLIYIVRNGVDVANSLHVREMRSLSRREKHFADNVRRHGTRSRLERAGYRGSARCLTLEGAFELWEQYLSRADNLLESINNDCLYMRYEDILQDPQPHLQRLAEFCQLPAGDDRIAAVCQDINPSRGYAYSLDAGLMSFYENVQDSPWMVRHNYTR